MLILKKFYLVIISLALFLLVALCLFCNHITQDNQIKNLKKSNLELSKRIDRVSREIRIQEEDISRMGNVNVMRQNECLTNASLEEISNGQIIFISSFNYINRSNRGKTNPYSQSVGYMIHSKDSANY